MVEEQCPNCGASNPSLLHLCPSCGRELIQPPNAAEIGKSNTPTNQSLFVAMPTGPFSARSALEISPGLEAGIPNTPVTKVNSSPGRTTFMAHGVRARAIIFAAGLAALLCLLLAAAGKGEPFSVSWVSFALVVIALVLQVRRIIWSAQLVVDGEEIRITGPVRLRTPVANIFNLFCDLGGITLIFRDRQLLTPKPRTSKQGTHAATLVSLRGYSLDDADAIRSALGLAPQALELPGGAEDRFFRHLRAATPMAGVTAALVVINYVIFLLLAVADGPASVPTGHTLLTWGANFGPLTLGGEWWRLFTSMFLHWSVLHLLANLWALLILGELMERMLGHGPFLVLYILAGLSGGVASLYWNPNVISAGASAAIFGLIGGLLGVLAVRKREIPNSVLVSLRKYGVTLVLLNFYLAFVLSGIDHAAHLGGALFGLVGGGFLGWLASHGTKQWSSLGTMVFAGVVCVALALLVMVRPQPSRALAEWIPALREFAHVEHRVLSEFNHDMQLVGAQRIAEKEFADRLANDLMPTWHKLRQRFDDLPAAPPELDMRVDVKLIQQYLLAREEAFALYVRAIREQSEDLGRQARLRSSQADELAHRLAALGGM